MQKRSRKAPKRKKAAHQKANPREHRSEEAAFNTEPLMPTRLMSEEEKHELIRAHAAKRPSRRGLGIGYYTAIIMSCLVVAGGWLLTLDENFGLGKAGSPDPALQTVRESVDSFKNNAAVKLPEVKKDIEKAKTQIDAAQGLVNGTSTENHQE